VVDAPNVIIIVIIVIGIVTSFAIVIFSVAVVDGRPILTC